MNDRVLLNLLTEVVSGHRNSRIDDVLAIQTTATIHGSIWTKLQLLFLAFPTLGRTCGCGVTCSSK